jgi:hypothetical protein
MLGIAAKYLGVTNPDDAFVEVVTKYLPFSVAIAGVILVIAAISSTADTEVFVVTSMIQRQLPRVGIGGSGGWLVSSTNGARLILVLVTAASVGAAIWFRELIGIYTWLLSALAVISPAVIFSLFVKTSRLGMFLALAGNALIFALLVSYQVITLDNIYLIAIPGLVIYALTLAFPRRPKVSA